MILHLEELALNAWPALETIIYRGCLLRFSNGYTKRANSANALYVNDKDLEAVIAYSEKAYKEKGLPVIFKIIDIDSYRRLDLLLETFGYEKVDTTYVMTVDFKKIDNVSDHEITLDEGFSDEWFETFSRCSKLNASYETTARGVLERIELETIVASLSESGRMVACGFGAIEDDHIGFFDIVVDESQRGKGFGKKIMNGIIGAAKEKCVGKGYLQVIASNIVAQKLYEGLGFKMAYAYWCRRKNA
ncbi:MAG: GNAT family N-acetyltransferase [Spirochaetales bacterium]|jgi:ribosomal protein S18 acetylase RimI-like enzyme